MGKETGDQSGRICLDELLRIQKDFQERYCPIEGISISSFASAIASEAMEIWAATGKWWYKDRQLDMEQLKEESVDILHFLLGLWLKLGLDGQEIASHYKRKMKINIERQKNEKRG